MSLKSAAFPLLLLAGLLSASSLEAAQSRVRFISNPPGVTVTDASLGELGTTPFDLNLKRGTTLDCTFEKEGFESRTKTGVVDQLKMVMRADLPPRPLTTVRLGVEPRQASIRLSAPDGTEIYSGESGRVHTLPNDVWGATGEAAFHVEIWAPGYHPHDESVQLARHERHDLEFELTEVATMLSVDSQPTGVRVSDAFLGELGQTPLESKISLVELLRARSRLGASQGDAARLVLTFSKGGFQTRARQVDLDFEKVDADDVLGSKSRSTSSRARPQSREARSRGASPTGTPGLVGRWLC